MTVGTLNDATDTLKTSSPKSGGGNCYGQSAADKIAFYGSTPIAQPTNASQAVITDASGGTGAATNGILTLTGTYNSAIIANALATLAAQGNAMRNALVSLGIIKGS